MDKPKTSHTFAKQIFKRNTMKKKMLAVSAASLIISSMIGVNVMVSKQGEEINRLLNVGMVEALAADEEYEVNSWYQWLSQGITKDEREFKRSCPSDTSGSGYVNGSYNGVGVGVGGSYSQQNPSGREEIRCAHGYENCTTVDC